MPVTPASTSSRSTFYLLREAQRSDTPPSADPSRIEIPDLLPRTDAPDLLGPVATPDELDRRIARCIHVLSDDKDWNPGWAALNVTECVATMAVVSRSTPEEFAESGLSELILSTRLLSNVIALADHPPVGDARLAEAVQTIYLWALGKACADGRLSGQTLLRRLFGVGGDMGCLPPIIDMADKQRSETRREGPDAGSRTEGCASYARFFSSSSWLANSHVSAFASTLEVAFRNHDGSGVDHERMTRWFGRMIWEHGYGVGRHQSFIGALADGASREDEGLRLALCRRIGAVPELSAISALHKYDPDDWLPEAVRDVAECDAAAVTADHLEAWILELLDGPLSANGLIELRERHAAEYGVSADEAMDAEAARRALGVG